MQFPTRELTRVEFDLVLAISQVMHAKWAPTLKEAEEAAKQAENHADKIEAELKATPAYAEIQRLVHGPSAELSEHITALGNGNNLAGYHVFKKAWDAIEAPWHQAGKECWEAGERLEQLKIDASSDDDRAIALTFLRLGYRAGAQDALNIATTPASPAAILKFMNDLIDDSPATDTMIAATVDKILASPAMAAVIGGER